MADGKVLRGEMSLGGLSHRTHRRVRLGKRVRMSEKSVPYCEGRAGGREGGKAGGGWASLAWRRRA